MHTHDYFIDTRRPSRFLSVSARVLWGSAVLFLTLSACNSTGTTPTVSSEEIILSLNNAANSGLGNSGRYVWTPKATSPIREIKEAWYVPVDNLGDLPKFGTITVKPEAAGSANVVVTWAGNAQKLPALLRIRIYALYTVSS